ncbi:MAG: hypothetical protein R3D02_06595 [Hyphomicrobiales bacterium]
MRYADFEKTLSDKVPPEFVRGPLGALWHLARGDWERAHLMAQADSSKEGAWVHAHLHRIEGDAWNAGYWYSRAGKPHCRLPVEEERRAIIEALAG